MEKIVNTSRLYSSLATLALGFCTSQVLAVDSSPGAFELDGNAEDDVPVAVAGDDWDTPPAPAGSATTFTGIVVDKNGTDDIFTGGGSKTPNLIGDWKWKSSPPPPDKDNITNAYAANYNILGKQVVYFGADLFDDNGDAELAFFFFQDDVAPIAGGSFQGEHVDGDPYVAVKFSNGGKIANIAVFEWWLACDKDDRTPTIPYSCAADNIRIVIPEGPATCDGTGGKAACAITNSGGPTPAPWPYLSKDGTTDFPQNTFFEGGINIFDIFGENKCFSSFGVMTGASTSFQSTAKDFALGSFDVCSVDVSKTCVNDDLNDDTPSAISYNVRGCGYNDGGGTINITSLLNSINGATPAAPSGLQWYSPGQVDDGSGGLRDFNPVTDCTNDILLKQAVDNGSLLGADVSSVDVGAGDALVYQFPEVTSSNGPSDVVTIDAQGTDGTDIADDTASAVCPIRLFPAALSVDKQCTADLVDAGSAIQVQINVLGQVCNDGQVTLTNLTLADDSAMPASGTVSLTPAKTTLAPGECTSYSGSYTPASIPSGDTCPFADQVVATATTPVNTQQSEYCVPVGEGSYPELECTATSNTATCVLRATDGDGDCSTGPLSPLP